MKSEKLLRIISDRPLPGAMNMAIDESILQAVNENLSPATLRFYQWDEPTISLGYFQKYDDFVIQDEVIRNMPVLRRQTGGGAILHDDELTYSLVLPLNSINTLTNIESMYQLVHNACQAALKRFGIDTQYRGGRDRGNSQRGPFFCFARQHRLDLVVGEDKILGSAQRRISKAVLQHGSLILTRHFAQQPSGEANRAADKAIDLNLLIEHISLDIARQLGLEPVKKPLSETEQGRQKQLQEKYNSSDWNHQR